VIEAILDRLAISDFIRLPMVEGKDEDGKHFGTQVFPGNSSVVLAQVPEESVDGLFAQLAHFRAAKPAHQHVQALMVPIERRL
jgi:hypothetical protein